MRPSRRRREVVGAMAAAIAGRPPDYYERASTGSSRVPAEWVLDELANVGLRKLDSSVENGLVTMVATKKGMSQSLLK